MFWLSQAGCFQTSWCSDCHKQVLLWGIHRPCFVYVLSFVSLHSGLKQQNEATASCSASSMPRRHHWLDSAYLTLCSWQPFTHIHTHTHTHTLAHTHKRTHPHHPLKTFLSCICSRRLKRGWREGWRGGGKRRISPVTALISPVTPCSSDLCLAAHLQGYS